jgi:uncharacterized alkaline shock family protein YloU
MTNSAGQRERPTDLGMVRINNDAITTIASIAAMEVRGVHKMGGGLRKTILELIHGRSFGGVRICSKDNEVKLVVFIIVNYGVDIPRVADEVQDGVKRSVEKMTGLVISEVDVVVEGVLQPSHADKEKKRADTA